MKTYKVVSDALHTLLHCALKDTEYKTQKEQFEIVANAFERLIQENQNLEHKQEKLKDKIEEMLAFCKNDSNGEKTCKLQIRFFKKLLNMLEE